jgi:hypothetical protein
MHKRLRCSRRPHMVIGSPLVTKTLAWFHFLVHFQGAHQVSSRRSRCTKYLQSNRIRLVRMTQRAPMIQSARVIPFGNRSCSPRRCADFWPCVCILIVHFMLSCGALWPACAAGTAACCAISPTQPAVCRDERARAQLQVSQHST